MNINKPEVLKEFDLIAIIDLHEQPTNLWLPENTPYHKSDLAVNFKTKKLQTYINSSTKEGLQKFIIDYPSAVVQENEMLVDDSDWNLLIAPRSAKPNETTLDSYFRERHLDSGQI